MVGENRRILLVEDDPEDANLLIEAFREVDPGVSIQHVQDGDAAWEVLQVHAHDDSDPPMVVLDLHLGPEYGVQLLKRWRSHANLQSMPVAILTSSTHDKDIANAKAADATSYYVKPGVFDAYLALAQDLQVFWLDSRPPEHA